MMATGSYIEHDPVTLKIAGWSKMQYDATLALDGVIWRRVYLGFGGRGDREDWVADLPALSINVSRYNNETAFSKGYGYETDDRIQAMRWAMERAKSRAERGIRESIKSLTALNETLDHINESIRERQKDVPQ